VNRKILVWLILCCIWSTTWVAIKIGLDVIPPFTFAALRFLIAGNILALIAAARKTQLPQSREEWNTLWQSGLLSVAFNFGAVFWGEQYVSSGLASVLNSTVPLFGIVFAHKLVAGEQMTRKKLVGVLLGILGVAIIFSDQLHAEGSVALWASVVIVLGAAAVSYSAVLVKVRAKRVNAVVLSAGQMLVAVPVLLGAAMMNGERLSEIRWNYEAAFALLYLAVIGSCVAFVLYYWLIKQIQVTKALMIVLVVPILAVAVGILTRGEELTWRLFVGGGLIILGVGTIVLNRSLFGLKKEY